MTIESLRPTPLPLDYTRRHSLVLCAPSWSTNHHGAQFHHGTAFYRCLLTLKLVSVVLRIHVTMLIVMLCVTPDIIYYWQHVLYCLDAVWEPLLNFDLILTEKSQ